MNCYGGTVSTDAISIVARPMASLPALANVSARILATVASLQGPAYSATTTSFRVSPSASAAYAVYLSGSVSPALGGLVGAGARCLSAAPTGVSSAKAFLFSSTGHPCITANCTDASNALDWVLASATPYGKTDGTLLFTTDATSPIFSAWPMAQMLG